MKLNTLGPKLNYLHINNHKNFKRGVLTLNILFLIVFSLTFISGTSWVDLDGINFKSNNLIDVNNNI